MPAFWKKIQNTQGIKRTLFDWMKQDKMCTFLRKSSFSSYVQHKNRKTNNSTYLVSVRCSEAGGTYNWHKISWIICLFLCCTKLEKEDFLENLHALSCFVQLKSVLLIYPNQALQAPQTSSFMEWVKTAVGILATGHSWLEYSYMIMVASVTHVSVWHQTTLCNI